MKLLYLLIFMCFLIGFRELIAQEHLHLQYEHSISFDAFYGNYFHNTDIEKIFSNDICCENIAEGEGIGREFILSWKYSPFFYSQFVLSFGFAKSETYFSRLEDEDISVNGNLYPGLFNHNLKIFKKQLVLSIGYEYNLIKRLYAGTHFKVLLNNSEDYTYAESIIIPSDKGVFKETGTRTRNKLSGNSDNNPGFGISFNLYYIFALDKSGSLYFSPNFQLTYYNDGILDEVVTNALGYHFGISIHKMFKSREFFKK